MLNTGPTLGGSQLKTSSWLQPLPAPTGKPGGLRPGRAKFQMCHSSLPLPHINPFLRQSPTKEQMKGLLPLTHTPALRWRCPHSGWGFPPQLTRKMLPSQSNLDNSIETPSSGCSVCDKPTLPTKHHTPGDFLLVPGT